MISDIETTVEYLCTCATKSDKDYWINLRRLINYPKKTIDNFRVIGENIVEELFTWVDYAVYDDIKGQKGGTIYFGNGNVHFRSRKKLNTKS